MTERRGVAEPRESPDRAHREAHTERQRERESGGGRAVQPRIYDLTAAVTHWRIAKQRVETLRGRVRGRGRERDARGSRRALCR